MGNTFESKVMEIINIHAGFPQSTLLREKIISKIIALHVSELSKRDELIEAYKELTFVLNQLADYEINKDNTDKAFELRLKISELSKELGKI